MPETFRLKGEVDLATSDHVRAALMAHAQSTTGDVVVDCSRMTFLDSTGVEALLYVNDAIRRRDCRLRLTNVAARCRRPLEILGLADLLAVENISD